VHTEWCADTMTGTWAEKFKAEAKRRNIDIGEKNS